MKTYINNETKELVQKKYEELKASGDVKGFLSEGELGGLELFINKKPKYVISELTIGDDTVYVGSEEVTFEKK